MQACFQGIIRRDVLTFRPNDWMSSRCSFSVKQLQWCAPKESSQQATPADEEDNDKTSNNSIGGAIHSKKAESTSHSTQGRVGTPVKSFGIVAAMSKNRIIGMNGGIPWRLPKDRQIFKSLTKDSVLVMGRKTFEERPEQDHIDHAASCIIISNSLRNPIAKTSTQLEVVDSLDKALNVARERVDSIVASVDEQSVDNPLKCWVVGGERVYNEALKHKSAKEVHLSIVDIDVDPSLANRVDGIAQLAMFPAKYRWDGRFKRESNTTYSPDGAAPGFSYQVYTRTR